MKYGLLHRNTQISKGLNKVALFGVKGSIPSPGTKMYDTRLSELQETLSKKGFFAFHNLKNLLKQFCI